MTASTGSNNAPEPGPTLARVRKTLTELIELTEERANTIAAAEGERTRTVRTSEKRYEQQTAGAAADLESSLRASEEEEREQLALIADRYDATIKKNYDERNALIRECEEWARAKKEAIDDDAKEAKWLATSVHDSDVAQAHAQAKARIEALDDVSEQCSDTEELRTELFTRLRITREAPSDADTQTADAPLDETIELAKRSADDARAALERIASSRVLRASRGAGFLVLAIVLLIVGATAGFFSGGMTVGNTLYAGIGGGVVAAILARLALGALAKRLIDREGGRSDRSHSEAVAFERTARERTQTALRDRLRDIDDETARETDALRDRHTERVDRMRRTLAERVQKVHDRCSPTIERLEQEREEKRDAAAARRSSIESQARERFDRLTADARAERDRVVDEAHARADGTVRALDERWEEASPRLSSECAALHNAGERHAPGWEQTGVNTDATPPPLVRVGRVGWSVPAEAAGTPIGWSSPRTLDLPLTLEFPRLGSMVVEATHEHRDRAIGAVRGAMLRLLTTIPPGKVRFTIVDPVGLGESFAAFMHLADHQDQLVSGRIWTEPRHIDQRLLDLTEHMESVIQKYLRNDYPTIEAYNRAAGEIAEPYRYLVIADFPTNLSDTGAKRVASILNSGARCGVHTIILRDPDAETPKSLPLAELYSRALVVRAGADGCVSVQGDDTLARAHVTLDTPPDDARTKALLREVGERSADAGRVQVPFTAVGPGEGEGWSLSAADALRIPIGRSGASKVQQLVLGEGTAQHALIAGRTGSGKSTLFHVIVTSCAAWYATHEVELYLVDFKKGVEFKPYATHDLPHARVIAIETDRAFGLSVLQRIDRELTDRGERMRTAQVQNLATFRGKTGERMPRVLLVVDEFQELFVEDDQIAQEAAILLDRIVRQGRAFGVHVVLGSQTMGGAYAINRATMSQMNVRIALQCDEQDSYLILGEDNAAARLLERPGEAVYNAQGGKVEANSPFQVVWLPDAVRDEQLARLASRARSEGMPAPETVVFEGNAPADTRNTPELVQSRQTPVAPHEPLRAHLGVPVAIAPPVAATIERGRAENLLVLSTNADTARSILSASLLGLDRLLGATPGAAVHLVHQPADDAHDLGALASSLTIDVRTSAPQGVGDALLEIDAELERRSLIDAQGDPPVVLVLAGLHRCRDVTKPDDAGFSFGGDDGPAQKTPGDLLDRIVRDGPQLGVHTLVWADTLDAFERAFDRRRMGEFAHRVLTQMNAMDSSAVLDSPAASRLPMGRALYYNDRTTSSSVIRPYAFPTQQPE